MQKIKVLQIFTNLNRGGAETNIMNYYRRMDRTCFQMDFMVHREEEGAYEPEIRQLGGKVFRLPAIHPLHLRTYKKAVHDFFNTHPEYQIIHGQLSELGVFIYEEAKRRKIPVIIAHAHNAPSPRDYDAKFIFRQAWKYRMRSSVNAYFTCGSLSAEWLFGRNLAKQAFPMANAIDIQKFKYRAAPKAKGGLTNYIHVGRFNRQKNHAFLIEVFAALVQKDPASHLFLVGDGELQPQIEHKVRTLGLKSYVTMLGLRSDVDELLQEMDVFLLPSWYEGLPVSLVEAQASGIRCVISDGVPAEAVLVSENVKILPLRKDAAFWANEIMAFSSYERKDVSAVIRQKGYDISENVQLLENKYRELLEKSQ